MNEYMSFDKMITPVIIKVIFWVAVVLCVFGGLLSMMSENVVGGIALMIFGPLAARVYAELLLVLFQVHSRMNDIHQLLAERLGSGSTKTALSTDTPGK